MATWKPALGLATAPSSPPSEVCTANGSQLVGLSVNSLRSRLICDRAQAQRHAADDLRQRIGGDADPGRDRIDVDRRPHDDVAEVVGALERGGDHGQAQRSAAVRAREVDLAGEGDGMRAGARRGRRGADLAARRALRHGLLGGAAVVGVAQFSQGRLRAVGDAAGGSRRGPGGAVTVTVFRFCSPSPRFSCRLKGARLPARVFALPAWTVGENGRGPLGQALPPGPLSTRQVGERVLRGQFVVPGDEFAFHREGAALRRRREQAAFGAEEVHRELGQRRLGQVLEGDRQLTGLRVGDAPSRRA